MQIVLGVAYKGAPSCHYQRDSDSISINDDSVHYLKTKEGQPHSDSAYRVSQKHSCLSYDFRMKDATLHRCIQRRGERANRRVGVEC